jgi:ribonuclease P protein component
MLSRSSRLTREAFKAVFERGKRKRLPYGQVLFMPAGDFRAAIVVSKKVEATAVGRNLLRRRLYAALDALKAEGRTGHIVFIAAAPLKGAPTALATETLQDAIRSFPV